VRWSKRDRPEAALRIELQPMNPCHAAAARPSRPAFTPFKLRPPNCVSTRDALPRLLDQKTTGSGDSSYWTEPELVSPPADWKSRIAKARFARSSGPGPNLSGRKRLHNARSLAATRMILRLYWLLGRFRAKFCRASENIAR
jgi:hypothetical protein